MSVAVYKMRPWLFGHLFEFAVGTTDELALALNCREKSMTKKKKRPSGERKAKRVADLHGTKEAAHEHSSETVRVDDAQATRPSKRNLL